MVFGFAHGRYPTTTRGPDFNQIEEQNQDDNEQKKATDAIRLAMPAHQKIISQKTREDIFQRTGLLFLNLMVNIFYRWPSILLQKFRKTKI